MRPLITPEEMRRVDAGATEPLEHIIERVGALVAMEAIALMGGTYGRRVVVVAGPGNNGADGRAAARHLEHRGVCCVVFDPDVSAIPACDLVIDAAFGTGLSRDYRAPAIPDGTLVLAIDIASGHDGLTGEAHGRPFRADRTVVLGALKPGNLFEPARSAGGDRRIVDIGLDATELITPSSHEIEAPDVAAWLPTRPADTHKWKAACWVIAGSPGMAGAAELTVRGAQRGGASYVRLSSPGSALTGSFAEAVMASMSKNFETPDIDRFASMVIGPGLGRDPGQTAAFFDLVERVDLPMVLDADALWHLGSLSRSQAADALANRVVPAVLTPHDGEFFRIWNGPPGSDRIAAAQAAAEEFGAVMLLKGPTTVIAAPESPAFVMSAGTTQLASAGTGDVLAGLIGAFLALGMAPHLAAASAAFVHAQAAELGPRNGLVAGDLPDLVTAALKTITD